MTVLACAFVAVPSVCHFTYGHHADKRYHIKGFHNTVLETGNVPLAVLEQVVYEWIASRKRHNPNPNPGSVLPIRHELFRIAPLLPGPCPIGRTDPGFYLSRPASSTAVLSLRARATMAWTGARGPRPFRLPGANGTALLVSARSAGEDRPIVVSAVLTNTHERNHHGKQHR